MNDRQPQKTDRLWTPGFIELILISFLTSLSFSLSHTLISSYAVSFGAELTAAGAAVGLYSISAMVVRPFGGFFSDQFNKKKLLSVTSFLLCVALSAYCLCRSIGLLILLRILHGVIFGINSTVNFALAAEVIPKSRTGEGLGYYGVGQVVSQVIGPMIGVAVKNATSFNTLFIGSAVTVLIGAVGFQLLFNYPKKDPVPDSHGPVKGRPSERAHRTGAYALIRRLIATECIFYALTAALFSMSNGVVNSFLLLMGEERGIAGVSLFFTVNALVLFILRITIGKLLDRTKLLYVVTASLITGALSMGMIGISSSLPLLIAAAAMTTH